MKRRVTRAKTPLTVPTISQIAAALILASAGTAEAAEDAGAPTSKVVLVAPAGSDAGASGDAGAAGEHAPIRVFIDNVERAFGTVELAPGRHVVRFEYRDGQSSQEQFLLMDGETRNISPLSCAYHPGAMMGGVQMPPYEPRSEGGGGCCGSTSNARVAGMDVRAIAAMALAAVVSVKRRRKRDEP